MDLRGRHDRGIDFESRVRFDLDAHTDLVALRQRLAAGVVEEPSAASAIGKVIHDAIDWEKGVEAGQDGPMVTVKAEIADALKASPFQRSDRRTGD
jgi:hypothetical protein